jgi:hypothetical protein
MSLSAFLIVQTLPPYDSFIKVKYLLILGCVVSSAYLAIEPTTVQDGFYDSQR